ncbi:helix-turn-helix domain-containing protein [Arsenophonus nasoniae]|uniref:Helix-turn-helix transcriptional regulator n=1 Tax=Arsenophonus nasoniae TaxID=638 RepID=A0AA95GBK4_9GAMM|nr:helix-turn-helix transcriptional regulator [Arsenophonus nasoniae]WGL94100.1 helix-turn-helix transcriptional regulator [Arsenophonus nasoniae]
MNMGQKIKFIRKAENLTQSAFCKLLKMPLNSLKKYEAQHSNPNLNAIMKIAQHPKFEKYALWLINDNTAPESGQISPDLSHYGQEETALNPLKKKTG